MLPRPLARAARTSPSRAVTAARGLTTAAVASLAVIGLTGCGSDDDTSAAGAAKPALTVSAATSLKKAFTAYGEQFTSSTARFSFAGSDQLAAQIEQGVKPDVFASANTKLPDALFAKGLVERPVTFAGNRLVIAVPADSTKVRSIDDLEKKGVTIAAGSATVPIGSYTRKVLAGLPSAEEQAILGNVRSSEPDVGGVIGKVTEGAVDAGFVYVTDAQGAGDGVKAIELPASLSPKVAYGVAIVKGTAHRAQAQAFIDGLVSGDGQQDLISAGFEPAP